MINVLTCFSIVTSTTQKPYSLNFYIFFIGNIEMSFNVKIMFFIFYSNDLLSHGSNDRGNITKVSYHQTWCLHCQNSCSHKFYVTASTEYKAFSLDLTPSFFPRVSALVLASKIPLMILTRSAYILD